MERPTALWQLASDELFQAQKIGSLRVIHASRFRRGPWNCQILYKDSTSVGGKVSQEMWNWLISPLSAVCFCGLQSGKRTRRLYLRFERNGSLSEC